MSVVLCVDGKTTCPEPGHTGCTDRAKLCAEGQPFVEPVKVVPYEPGAADVFDRGTGEKIGFVIRGFYKVWTAYEPFDGRAVPRAIGRFRYRRDAARSLWSYERAVAR